MTMSDPIADMLTRIRNAHARSKSSVSMPSSKVKAAIARVLKEEGYILNYQVTSDGNKASLEITLKYYLDQPVIQHIARVSKPGQRNYCDKDNLLTVIGGMGIAIVSTSQGIMTAHDAGVAGQGGEILCSVY